MRHWSALTTVVFILCTTMVACCMSLRVKDLVRINTGGAHKLIGYGLVVGLQGTGDGKKATFTPQTLANMLEEFGVSVEPSLLEVDNVAAVIVTAELPADAAVGTKIDVTVSSMGDAESLQGGTLLLTSLRGADGQVYAIAQGPLSIGGYNIGKDNASVRKNHSLVGRVPNGASTVRPISAEIECSQILCLELRQPDFTTAARLAESINSQVEMCSARPINAGMVEVTVALQCPNVVDLVRKIEGLPVEPDIPARVVINERTGTVVIDSKVRILPVAIAHGNLTVKVQREYEVSQPPPLVWQHDDIVINPGARTSQAQTEPSIGDTSTAGTASGTAITRGNIALEDAAASAQETVQVGAEDESVVPSLRPPPKTGGRTVVMPKDKVEVEESEQKLLPVGGEPTLQDLIEGLNALGVSPRDLIAIIQALKEAGALQAELIIQ